MAQGRHISGPHELRPHCPLDCSSTTPPDRQAQLPPTPPATEERRGGAPDASVNDLMRMLDEIKDRALASSTAPLIEVQINEKQYRQLHDTIERSFPRFDYEPQNSRLILRMPISPIHGFFCAMFEGELRDQLRNLAEAKDEVGNFAAKIVSGGSSRLFLAEADPETSRMAVRRQPDAQFQHPGAAYPGVVVEVSYSQDGKNLRKLAQDYILYSNGDIKAVIGIDINYGGMESAVSLWRPKYTWSDDEDIKVLEMTQDIVHMPFRSADGSATNQQKSLTLGLDEFATDELSKGYESVSVSVTFDRLARLLDQAEQIQRARESAQGGSVRSGERTRRRRLSSSPIDEMRPEDEEKSTKQERAAVKSAEAKDKDFEAPAAKGRA